MRRNKVTVVGMGLIGGSLYKAALAAGHDATALHHGDEPGRMDADIVFLALPPGAAEEWMDRNGDSLKDGCIVMDVCGVKRPITEHVGRNVPSRWTFIGAHPMAGREKCGFENSLAGLFGGASMILTPFESTPRRILEELDVFFKTLGFARTVVTDPLRHDDTIAFTSQLCHIIASAYARDGRVGASVMGFSAGSYADMTRIATMDEKTWTSLFMANADVLVPVIDAFTARMQEYRDALVQGDEGRLSDLIRAGAEAKRRENAMREKEGGDV